jgi:hypothetical protein
MKSEMVEGIMSIPNYATAPATGHRGLVDQVLLERLYFGECKTLA